MENNAERLNKKRTLQGKVVSDKMNKTIVVQTVSRMKHATLGKIITLRNKYKAHDEKNEAKTGDQVTIRETRPISKEKRWLLVSVDAKNTENKAEVAS